MKAVIFDWAGTVVDFGSCAPMGVFVKVFGEFGVPITVAEARVPMGLPKRDHIAAVLRLPRVAQAWQDANRRAATKQDIDAIYERFLPANREIIADFATLVPGVKDVVAALRDRGIKIGSTTGYTRDLMEILAPLCAAQGFAPDNLVCAGDLAAGRPSPLMMWQSFVDLGVWPASAVVKVDDTEPGIAEGRAAGSWTIGVAVSGNAMGLDEREIAALEPGDFTARRERAAAMLSAAGADIVIDSVADLLPSLAHIEARMKEGERPSIP
ncbi:MAG: phosphonoacetaldehyde hydrolase [Alphaproteobacteria bacterium]|nr:phosphonoacetaldehyde hydrolase [Alphaproteobacteria bacterium]